MSNPCVYTGAVVYLKDYNAIVNCDLFEIAGAVLIEVQGEWVRLPSEERIEAASHQFELLRGGGYGHVSRNGKIIFAPSACCIGPRR